MAEIAKQDYRMMFRFWLNARKDEELALADYCAGLKNQRSFTDVIRKALTLFQSLHARRTDVLFDLFPWLEQWIEERAERLAEQKKSSGNDDTSGGKIIDLTAKIERLEQLLLERQTSGGMLMAAHEHQRRALPAPRSSPDDTQIIMSRVKADNTAAAQNFMNSLSAMAGTDFATKTSGGINKLAVPKLAAPSFDDDDTLLLNLTGQ